MHGESLLAGIPRWGAPGHTVTNVWARSSDSLGTSTADLRGAQYCNNGLKEMAIVAHVSVGLVSDAVATCMRVCCGSQAE